MKRVFATILLAAMLAVTAVGCKTAGSGTISIVGPSIVQEGVQTGVSVAVLKYPAATAYLQAAEPIICEAAGSTNVSPTQIVQALDSSPNLTALKTPEGALILQGALGIYTTVWNLYGTNITTSAAQPYLAAVCTGLQLSLPPVTAKLSKPGAGPSEWPVIQLP